MPSLDTENYEVINFCETQVTAVQWNELRNGMMTPVICVWPVVFNGVTIRRISGRNARYIADYCIGPGAVVRIRLCGGVIPTIDEVVSTGEAQFPDIPYYWNDDDIHLVANVDEDEPMDVEEPNEFSTLLEAAQNWTDQEA